MNFLLILFSLALWQPAFSTPHPANAALLAQPPPVRNLPLHIRNVTHNTCCINPGLTFDPCTSEVPCAYGRYCVTPDSLHPCPLGIVCICYPNRIVLCQDPAHCPLGETCAYRPQDHHAFCVSMSVVDVDPSYLIFRGGCVPCSNSRPPPIATTPPTSRPSTQPPTKAPGTTTSSTKRPSTNSPTTRPPSTQAPTKSPPTAAPPTRPVTVARQSRRPTPSPLASPPPSPRPSPAAPPARPTRQPVITAVPPPAPSPSPSAGGTPSGPTPTRTGGLAGDSCSDTSPCVSYRKCKRKDTTSDCDGNSDCICLGSRVCVCNDQCTDGEVCAGAPGRSYCYSPRLIDSLSWSTTLPCVGPVFSPEIGGATRPPTTTPPAVHVPGLTGELCRTDSNCRSPRKCVVGGGESCVAGEVLCDKDSQPCEAGESTCYCYALNTCNCSNDCKETEICTATTRGRICVSRSLLSESEYLQAIECHDEGEDGKPILIVNEPEPQPPVALTGTPRPTTVGIPGVTPGVLEQDADGGEGVCIEVGALKDFEAHLLVFENPRLARVLCDTNSSCATPGHIVIHHGNAMMMKTYCNIVGCENKIMYVNSPRFLRKLRIQSRSEGLEFSALAGKYETRTEEVVLAAAVRFGL